MNFSRRFGQIFWGLFLVILDVRINGFDMLPDFIGYALVAIGCGGLAVASARFSTAQLLCWILTVLTLIVYVVPSELMMAIGIVEVAINCAMIWSLLGAVMEFAAAKGRPDLSERASNRRIAYVALMGIASFVAVIADESRGSAPLAVVFVICMLVVLALILHLIYRVKRELANS